MKQIMKTTHVVIWLLISVIVLHACSKSDSSNGIGNNGNIIYMKNSVFSSASLQVSPGAEVIWVNDDVMVHTVTADDNRFNSGDIAVGDTFRYRFDVVGTYAYHCSYHSNMKGVIIAGGIR